MLRGSFCLLVSCLQGNQGIKRRVCIHTIQTNQKRRAILVFCKSTVLRLKVTP